MNSDAVVGAVCWIDVQRLVVSGEKTRHLDQRCVDSVDRIRVGKYVVGTGWGDNRDAVDEYGDREEERVPSARL